MIEDTIYARLRFRGKPHAVAAGHWIVHGNVIQIDSFSKIAFPGLRVGWCIGPESVIERLRLVKQSTDLHTDQLAQATLAEFIRRGLSGAPSRPNAQGLPAAARSAGRGAREAYAGRNNVDATRRRHVPSG